jgi:hypothetical protein
MSKKSTTWIKSALCGMVLAGAAVGCQSHIAGQTLPSAHYLRDDIQYFPAGPETRIPRQRRALEEYRLNRQAAMNPGEPPPAPEPIQ